MKRMFSCGLTPGSVKRRALRPKKRNNVRNRSRNKGFLRAVALGAGAFCLAFLVGYLLFLSQIYAATDPTPTQVDVIVAFSGNPRRIRVATNLLQRGYSERLIIVGQDNRDEVEKLRSANESLFRCCVKVDHRSKNTVEDAFLTRHLIQRMKIDSIMLVTSSFHMPRAKLELSRVLPNTRIVSYGITDDAFNIRMAFLDASIASKFLTQYILFVSSSIPGSRDLLSEQDARKALDFLSNARNLGLLVVAAASSILALLALSKHRERDRKFHKQVNSRSHRTPRVADKNS